MTEARDKFKAAVQYRLGMLFGAILYARGGDALLRYRIRIREVASLR